MRRVVGIALFAVAAAFSFYLHFNKVAKGYLERRVELGKVERGGLSITVDGDRCSELARFEGRFVRISGTVKGVKGRKIYLGCLEVLFHTSRLPEALPGDRLYLKGFVKYQKGRFYVDVWNEEFVRVER